jgi:hypothetical protein
MSLIKEIRDDPVYKRFKDIFENVRKRIDVEKAFKEATMLHEQRIEAAPKGDKRYSAQRLVDANMLDLATRSRLIRIRTTNSKQLSHLEAAMAAMRHHILTEYVDELKPYRSAPQRQALMDRVMKNAVEFVAECTNLNDTLDLIIKDVDQASHGYRHVVELLKLMADSKGRSL